MNENNLENNNKLKHYEELISNIFLDEIFYDDNSNNNKASEHNENILNRCQISFFNFISQISYSNKETSKSFMIQMIKKYLLINKNFCLSFFLSFVTALETSKLFANSNKRGEIDLFASKTRNIQSRPSQSVNEALLKNIVQDLFVDVYFTVKFFNKIKLYFYANNDYDNDKENIYAESSSLVYLPNYAYFVNLIFNFPEKIANFVEINLINYKIYAYALISEYYIYGLIDEGIIRKITKLDNFFKALIAIIYFFNKENKIFNFHSQEFLNKEKDFILLMKGNRYEYLSDIEAFYCQIDFYKVKIFKLLYHSFLDDKIISFFLRQLDSKYFSFYNFIFQCREIDVSNTIIYNLGYSITDELNTIKYFYFEYFLFAALDTNLLLDQFNSTYLVSEKLSNLNFDFLEILNFEKIIKKSLEKNNIFICFNLLDFSPIVSKLQVNIQANKHFAYLHKIICNESIMHILVTFTERMNKLIIEFLNKIVENNNKFLENLNGKEFYNLLLYLYLLLRYKDNTNVSKVSSNIISNEKKLEGMKSFSISHINLVLTYQGKIMEKSLNNLNKILFEIFNLALKRFIQKSLIIDNNEINKSMNKDFNEQVNEETTSDLSISENNKKTLKLLNFSSFEELYDILSKDLSFSIKIFEKLAEVKDSDSIFTNDYCPLKINNHQNATISIADNLKSNGSKTNPGNSSEFYNTNEASLSQQELKYKKISVKQEKTRFLSIKFQKKYGIKIKAADVNPIKNKLLDSEINWANNKKDNLLLNFSKSNSIAAEIAPNEVTSKEQEKKNNTRDLLKIKLSNNPSGVNEPNQENSAEKEFTELADDCLLNPTHIKDCILGLNSQYPERVYKALKSLPAVISNQPFDLAFSLEGLSETLLKFNNNIIEETYKKADKDFNYEKIVETALVQLTIFDPLKMTQILCKRFFLEESGIKQKSDILGVILKSCEFLNKDETTEVSKLNLKICETDTTYNLADPKFLKSQNESIFNIPSLDLTSKKRKQGKINRLFPFIEYIAFPLLRYLEKKNIDFLIKIKDMDFLLAKFLLLIAKIIFFSENYPKIYQILFESFELFKCITKNKQNSILVFDSLNYYIYVVGRFINQNFMDIYPEFIKNFKYCLEFLKGMLDQITNDEVKIEIVKNLNFYVINLKKLKTSSLLDSEALQNFII